MIVDHGQWTAQRMTIRTVLHRVGVRRSHSLRFARAPARTERNRVARAPPLRFRRPFGGWSGPSIPASRADTFSVVRPRRRASAQVSRSPHAPTADPRTHPRPRAKFGRGARRRPRRRPPRGLLVPLGRAGGRASPPLRSVAPRDAQAPLVVSCMLELAAGWAGG